MHTLLALPSNCVLIFIGFLLILYSFTPHSCNSFRYISLPCHISPHPIPSSSQADPNGKKKVTIPIIISHLTLSDALIRSSSKHAQKFGIQSFYYNYMNTASTPLNNHDLQECHKTWPVTAFYA